MRERRLGTVACKECKNSYFARWLISYFSVVGGQFLCWWGENCWHFSHTEETQSFPQVRFESHSRWSLSPQYSASNLYLLAVHTFFSSCFVSCHDLLRWNLFELLSPLLSVESSQGGAPLEVPILPWYFSFFKIKVFWTYLKARARSLFISLSEDPAGSASVSVLLHAVVSQHK